MKYKCEIFRLVWHFRRILVLLLGFFILYGSLTGCLYQHWKIQEVFENRASDDSFMPGQDQFWTWKPTAWSLIEETQGAIKAAGGLPGRVLSTSRRVSWEVAHPCASRHQLLPLWNRKKKSRPVANEPSNREPSRSLLTLFDEYANLHRTCTHGGDMAYLTKLFKSRNESDLCKFLVVEFGSYGVGNRLLWLVSAFQYALLTKRVILIDTRSTIHSLLCEPFPGSSWILPENFPYSSEKRWPMPADFQKVWDDWESKGIDSGRKKGKVLHQMHQEHEGLQHFNMQDMPRLRREKRSFIMRKAKHTDWDKLRTMDRDNIWKIVDDGRRLLEDETRRIPSFHEVQANDGWAPNPRFFCDKEQEHLHLVKWISLNSGCLYFLPDLFALPSVQLAMEELFPDREPLTHLLRHLILPVDSVWKQVRHLFTADFETASKVIGMQVRYRDGMPMYRSLNELVNTRISKCATDHGLIPSPALPEATFRLNNSRRAPVVIFIASLFSGLRDHLEIVYAETIEKTRSRGDPVVKLLQLSKFGFQSFNLDADHQAFAEIVCLSLADEIMTSPQSTYGQVAQAYGGLTPWLVEFDPHSSTDCVRGQSTEACYQLPIARFSCPFNKDVDGKAMADVAPYLKPCQDTDGLQLVPPWSPSLLSPNSTL